ncbi:MutS protein msh5, partial [Ascosphaera atra]
AGLDNLKDVYSGLESLLSQVAIDIAETLPEHVSGDINVIYFPQLGFNIAIPLDENGNAMYEGQDQDWEKVFITENRAYYKDFQKEIEITYELAQQTLAYEAMLMEASDVCGELDSTLALAHGASLYKLTRPRMTTKNIIDIKEGRHLLYEAAVPSFVPNDAFLVGGKGPRSSQASRKSVYLKQVASIVLMAHVGSFVAAKQATIGLTDKILTRITTRETVSKMKSSFMLDLEQISIALNLATHRSLLVIDEFGKGTESSDGAGLACGLFQYFLELGDERPKVLGATHFHEIFESGFLSPRPEMALGHMEVQVDKEASELEAQIVYLYKLSRPDASCVRSYCD